MIDFVARLLDLSAYEAAQRLAADFGLDTSRPSVVAQVKKYRPRVNQLKRDENFCMNVLSGYLHLLEDWKEQYAPEAPEDELDERFVEACHKLEYVEYREFDPPRVHQCLKNHRQIGGDFSFDHRNTTDGFLF